MERTEFSDTTDFVFQRFALGGVKSGTKFVVVASLVYSFIKERSYLTRVSDVSFGRSCHKGRQTVTKLQKKARKRIPEIIADCVYPPITIYLWKCG
jgi:hypothetical protein